VRHSASIAAAEGIAATKKSRTLEAPPHKPHGHCAATRVVTARIIVDYSFSDVNAESTKLAHLEAMQFGKALKRILGQTVEADLAFGLINLIKVDIAQWLLPHLPERRHHPETGCGNPPKHRQGTPPAGPSTGPPHGLDGESSPYFTASTKTITDLTNQQLQTRWCPPKHCLKSMAEMPLPEDDAAATASSL
jgi:hypothetical protein